MSIVLQQNSQLLVSDNKSESQSNQRAKCYFFSQNSSSLPPSPAPLLPELATNDLPPRKKLLPDENLQQLKQRMVSLQVMLNMGLTTHKFYRITLQDGNTTSHVSLECSSSPLQALCQPLRSSMPFFGRTPPSSRISPRIERLKEWMDI